MSSHPFEEDVGLEIPLPGSERFGLEPDYREEGGRSARSIDSKRKKLQSLLTSLFPDEHLKSESLERIEEVGDVLSRNVDSVVGAVVKVREKGDGTEEAMLRG